MKEELEKLDISMENISKKIMIIDENDPNYSSLLDILAQQYKTFIMLISKNPSKTEKYYIKYANLDYIKNILTSKGYLEQEPQIKGR